MRGRDDPYPRVDKRNVLAYITGYGEDELIVRHENVKLVTQFRRAAQTRGRPADPDHLSLDRLARLRPLRSAADHPHDD